MTERANSKKEGACPDWIKLLIFPDPDDPESFTRPQCVMTAQLDPRAVVVSTSRTKAVYYRFDPSKPLGVLLRNTHFVEFPTIEIWEEFRGTVVDTQGAVTQQPEEEHKPKRRKLTTKAGKKAISGLLGGYGSDSEEETETQNVMSMLGGYAGSDDEEDAGEVREEAKETEMDGLGDEDADGDTDDEVELDQATLLELMRQAQGSERWAENVGDDDLVDWGDELGDEPE
jgi:hypothetical protein